MLRFLLLAFAELRHKYFTVCTASSTTPIALQYFFVESKGGKALLVTPIPIYHCSCIIVVGLLEPLTA